MILSIVLIEIVADGSLDGSEETETYIVRTDGAETARTVRRSSFTGMPELGDVDANGLVVSRVNVTRDRDSSPTKQVFYYTATWATPEFSAEFVENPIDRAAEISWEGLEFSIVETIDAAGTAYRNSAGELYSEIPERPVGGGSVSITRNELANPATKITNFSFTSNSDTFHGLAIRLARLGKISATKVREQAYTFWKVTYPIDFRRDNWRLKVVDSGFNSLVGGVLKRIMVDSDSGKVAVATPALLNGAGVKLTGGAPVVFPAAGFVQYTEIAWTSLGLPNPFA